MKLSRRPFAVAAVCAACVLAPTRAASQATAPDVAHTKPTSQSSSPAPSTTQEAAPASKPDAPTSEPAPGLPADSARTSIAKSIAWLISKQNADGSWGTSGVDSLFEVHYSQASFYAWKLAGGALATQALLGAEETPERRAALEKALTYVLENERPKRGDHWDIDSNWALLYVFQLLDAAAADPRFASGAWQTKLRARGEEYAAALAAQQDPLGGWGYYEGPVVSRRPTWSTSFSTACVVPALVAAAARGWKIDPQMTARALKYVRNCALPNGAYEYDLNPVPRYTGGEHINHVKGSLSRMQICNWARRRGGDPTLRDEALRRGLGWFFEHHRFLDVARMKPIPHESWYQNAGYFYFFGHYAAALAINCLPEAEREAWHAQLRAHVVKVQRADGSSIDFPGSFYVYTASTAFSALALQEGLRVATPAAVNTAPTSAAPKQATPAPAVEAR